MFSLCYDKWGTPFHGLNKPFTTDNKNKNNESTTFWTLHNGPCWQDETFSFVICPRSVLQGPINKDVISSYLTDSQTVNILSFYNIMFLLWGILPLVDPVLYSK